MIHYLHGNILDSTAEVLVNPVNCRGVMGAGLAKQFANRFPGLEGWYKDIVRDYSVNPGDIYMYEKDGNRVLCFPTKNHWKMPSKIEYIESGMHGFCSAYMYAQADSNRLGDRWHFSSIAFPMLGCGLGGLRWDKVKPLMERFLRNAPFDSYIYDGQE